jgi:hypothetical protein
MPLCLSGSIQLMNHVAGYVNATRDQRELMGESLQQEPQQDKAAPQPLGEVSLLTNEVSM